MQPFFIGRIFYPGKVLGYSAFHARKSFTPSLLP
jgi:hypothetical protein